MGDDTEDSFFVVNAEVGTRKIPVPTVVDARWRIPENRQKALSSRSQRVESRSTSEKYL